MGLFSWLFKPKPTPKEIFLKEVPKKLEQASNPFYGLEHIEKTKSIKKFKGNLKADFGRNEKKSSNSDNDIVDTLLTVATLEIFDNSPSSDYSSGSDYSDSSSGFDGGFGGGDFSGGGSGGDF